MDGEVDGKVKAAWRRILRCARDSSAQPICLQKTWTLAGSSWWRLRANGLEKTTSLVRRDDELTLGSTATESAGVIKVVALIPMGPRMEDAMYSSYGIPVTLVSTRPRSSKAIFEYVDLALGAKRGFRFLTAVIKSAEISWRGEMRQTGDLPASEQGLYSS